MSNKKEKKTTSRRKFMVRSLVGVGVIMGVGAAGCNPLRRYMAGKANTVELPYMNPGDPDLWFEVLANNTVLFHCPKVEMGQGIFTSLAQIAADELGVNMNQLVVQHASSSGPLDSFATGGSTTISGLWNPLRELAATFRHMLVLEAAKMWQIEAKTLKVANAEIAGAGKSITFGELVSRVKDWKIPKTPKLKPSSEYKFIGKAIPRVDLKEKIMGAPIFGMDAHVPDMLYGAVVRPHMVDSSFQGADIEAAKNMPGVVKVVLEDDFVGVVAKSKIEAENAKDAIKAKWKVNKIWQQEEIESMILVGKGKAVTIQKFGNSDKLLDKDSENYMERSYYSPIGAHAHLEPNGALAIVEKDKAKIYISTQVVSITRDEVAERLGMKKKHVIIQPTFLGGGFGRRLHTPNAIQAAILSRAVGKPVHCFFDRRQEFQNDTFRPPTHNVLKATLAENGMIQAIEHNISSGDVAFGSPMVPSIAAPVMGADLGAWRGGMIQYEKIPNYKAISWRVKLPFATSWWRSLGLLANTFAVESFMDELAEKAGVDPIEFRLSQIQDNHRGFRLREVIKAARDKSGWAQGPKEGRALGFACSTDVNTPCAHVIEISMQKSDDPSKEARLIIHKVTCAIDPGLIINPDGVKAQCEGAICMGISAVMFEEMKIKDGMVIPVNYGQYKMALLKHAPRDIDVVLLQNNEAPGGVGEPPLGPIGAALANAIYALTGARKRRFPLG